MWLYRLNELFCPVVRLYWRLGLEGRIDRIPPLGPLVLASNHESYLDPWFIGMAFPRHVRYLILRDWYDRSPAWRAFFNGFGAEPVRTESPDATVEAVCALLDRGEVVGIFPEGAISEDGRIQRFRPGLSRIAARSGAPVQPVGVRGAYESLPRSRRLPRPSRVTVHVGEPIVFPGSPMRELPPRETSRAFQKAIFEAVCALADQPPPERTPRPPRPPTL